MCIRGPNRDIEEIDNFGISPVDLSHKYQSDYDNYLRCQLLEDESSFMGVSFRTSFSNNYIRSVFASGVFVSERCFHPGSKR